MIHQRVWTETSYCQCRWRAPAIAWVYCSALSDEGWFGTQKDRYSRPSKILQWRTQKTAELGLIGLSADLCLIFFL